MPPTGSKTGLGSAVLVLIVGEWARGNGKGVSFDSSTGFTLPNGAIRSPGASWVRRDRWELLSKDEQEAFAPLCPDFVVELRSPTDRLGHIKDKLTEYIENGAQQGWLIDPFERRVYIYRPGQAVKVFEDPETVSGDPEVPDFVLDVRELW